MNRTWIITNFQIVKDDNGFSGNDLNPGTKHHHHNQDSTKSAIWSEIKRVIHFVTCILKSQNSVHDFSVCTNIFLTQYGIGL